jgi:single-stranded DNA-binding protein
MSDLNVFTCTGRLGGDAETKDINGRVKARYRLAVQGRKDSTTWLTCEHWDPHQNLLPLMTKGQRVGLTGRIEEQKWTAKDGSEKTALVFVVGVVSLLGSKEQPADRPPSVVAGAQRRPKWEQDETPF